MCLQISGRNIIRSLTLYRVLVFTYRTRCYKWTQSEQLHKLRAIHRRLAKSDQSGESLCFSRKTSYYA